MELFTISLEKQHLDTIVHTLMFAKSERTMDKEFTSKIDSALDYLERISKKKIQVNSYTLYMGCGMTQDWTKLSFLDAEDIKELNSIGYSGKDTHGVKKTFESYLSAKFPSRSFSMVRTGGNGGEFTDHYTITVFG